MLVSFLLNGTMPVEERKGPRGYRVVVAMALSTREAAGLLGTSQPTVRALIGKGLLDASKEARGTRFSWRVNKDSVERHLKEHGRYDGQRRTGASRLEKLESELSALRAAIARDVTMPAVDGGIERERDDLRAQVVSLQDALTRSNVVAELQRDADTERAAVIDHLLAASAAGERADALRRQALAQLEEALAGFARPGHPGSIA